MAGHYKDSTYFMQWYHNLDENQKKQYNQKRYQQRKARQELHGTQYVPKNPELSMLKALHKRARDIPYCLVDDTTKPSKLLPWYLENKGQPCKYCGAVANSLDHIVPLSNQGKHCISNLQFLCWDCNRAKSNKSVEEFETWIKNICNTYTKDGNELTKVVV